MLFKECFKIHIIEYRANQGNVFPKKSSYCKDHAIQGFVNQGPTVLTFSNKMCSSFVVYFKSLSSFKQTNLFELQKENVANTLPAMTVFTTCV